MAILILQWACTVYKGILNYGCLKIIPAKLKPKLSRRKCYWMKNMYYANSYVLSANHKEGELNTVL